MSQPFCLDRRTSVGLLFIAGLALAAPGGAQAQGSARDPGAEQFIQVQAQRVLNVLSDKSMSTDAKIHTFRNVVDQIADVPRITRFVLGKYARTATPAQRQQFDPLFRTYAQDVYESRLNEYHGETVKACVVLKEDAAVTADELIACCARDLAPYKVPKRVEIRASLPMSAVGKILYRVLRDEVAASAR